MEGRILTIKPWKKPVRIGRLYPMPAAGKPRRKGRGHGRSRPASPA